MTVYYGVDGEEGLQDSVHEAVEQWILDREMTDEEVAASDEELRVLEYKQVELPMFGLSDRLLEHAVEYWEEEYGDPDGRVKMLPDSRYSEALAIVEDALGKLVPLLHVWAHEPTNNVITVKLSEWAIPDVHKTYSS